MHCGKPKRTCVQDTSGDQIVLRLTTFQMMCHLGTGKLMLQVCSNALKGRRLAYTQKQTTTQRRAHRQ